MPFSNLVPLRLFNIFFLGCLNESLIRLAMSSLLSIFLSVGENEIKELVTWGFGLNESGEISNTFLQSAYIAVVRERMEYGCLYKYFSATSFWIIKNDGFVKYLLSIIFFIIFFDTLKGSDPKKVVFWSAIVSRSISKKSLLITKTFGNWNLRFCAISLSFSITITF